jgi:hypothetical protein
MAANNRRRLHPGVMSRKHWIDLIVGLAVTTLTLLVIEASLGAVGFGEVPPANNWSRGFDPSARYLVPIPDSPGHWQTRFKHKSRPEVTIPPRGDKIRIVTFGGSNTAGFDTGYLEEVLAERVGDDRFEAFNLGRPGYGSERVRFIFLQAIEVLDPDIVVIYTGHNEFVERGFQMDLEEASAGAWASAPLQVARRTRIFNTIVQHYAEEVESRQKEPEAWDNEYTKFANITYDETLKYFQAYESNVRAMCQAALDRDIKVVLCTIVHNRLSVPFSSTFPDDLSDEDIASFEQKRASGVNRLPEYLTTLLPAKEKHRVHASDLVIRPPIRDQPAMTIEYDDYTGWSKARGFLRDRDPMLQHASRWAPVVHKMYRDLLKYQRRELDEKSPDSVKRGEKLLAEALEIYPDHPRALFELALAKHLNGRDENTVAELLVRAGDLDRAPRKGSNMVNTIVRRVGAETPEVVLADIDLSFQGCLPNGIIGWEWMADHCHLNRGGRDAIVEQFAKAILDNWSTLQIREVGNSQ